MNHSLRLALVLALAALVAGCLPPTSPTPSPTLARAATARPSPAPSSTPRPTPTSTVTPQPTSPPTPTSTVTPQPTPPPSPSATPSPSPAVDPVEDILAGMSLEEKVGQMLMVGIPGPTLDDAARHAVVDLRAGGVTLIARNAETPEQLAQLLRDLQILTRLPLFVAINHEGGPIVRVQEGVTAFPSAMALGATGDPGLAREVGLQGATELAAMGVNMNLAPVLDVNTEPNNPIIGWRSFGADPGLVAEFGAQFIQGTRAGGVIAVAKHFPGHGGVDVDSHLALPVLTSPLESLWAVELAPFRRAVAEGVDVIMGAHLAVPALTGDPELPATLSAAVMSDLLRAQLGFGGLVITDDLDMKGITERMSQAEAAVRAVEAGSDMVMVMRSGRSQDETYAALLAAVQSGRLSAARIDASVRRILALKLKYGLFNPPARSLDVVGAPEHEALASRVADEAVTAVAGSGLPFTGGLSTLVVSPQTLNPGPAPDDGRTLFGEEVCRRAPACEELLYNPADPADEARVLARAQAEVAQFDQLVLGLWDAALHNAQNQDDTPFAMAQALAAAGRPLAVVAWRLPYDLARVPQGAAALAAYGDAKSQVEAVARVLFGEIPAQGRLPVPLQ